MGANKLTPHTGVDTNVYIPCVECAKAGNVCCVTRQIVITDKDIDRVAAHVGHRDFFVYEFPEAWYLEPSYDQDWLPLVLQPDGRLQILKRKEEDKSCGFLGDKGCVLPFDVRPRLCQLHPYMFTEKGIIGLDMDCLISHMDKVEEYLAEHDMPIEKAKAWQKELYDELLKARRGK